MDKNHIVYFIHVPWKWIKQRPHFIAEELAKDYDVVVAERKPMHKEYRSEGVQSVNLVSYFQLPKDRIPIVHFINGLLQKITLRRYLKRADLIWITNPYQYSYFKKSNLSGKVIYDCMDDLPEFEPTQARRVQLERLEKRLYTEADVVIASSKYLKDKLVKRYGARSVTVVNNAIKKMDTTSIPTLPKEVLDRLPVGQFVMTYIGTIEKWIDVELLEHIVDVYPQVSVCIFGPLKIEFPQHERIIYCGMVPHDYVFSLMDNSDALIMPFVLNELILSVNPVKLYEYIYSGKPCLAPRYGESECFEDYVYLYNSKDDCCQMIGEMINGKGAKHTQKECRAYAMTNTWSERIKQIESAL